MVYQRLSHMMLRVYWGKTQFYEEKTTTKSQTVTLISKQTLSMPNHPQ